MAQRLRSVTAGLVCVGAVMVLASAAAKGLWPAYAAAAPTRAYSVPMLLVRLLAGALAMALGGRVGGAGAAKGIGLAVLAVSLPWHVHIWPQYPLWYHLCWFAAIVPAAMLGGRISAQP